jgi:FixJ family two-component response regulator
MVRERRTAQHRRLARRAALPPAKGAPRPADAMSTTAYVLLADAQQRARIDTALARCVDRVVFLDTIDALPSAAAEGGSACLIVSVDAAVPDAVKTIGDLRVRGNPIGVIALGSHATFRQAVDIARIAGTDVLECPVSDRELRRAVQRMCAPRS